MNTNAKDQRIPRDKPRPESQPHGTTKDQIDEMESEGQGQGGAAKTPKATP